MGMRSKASKVKKSPICFWDIIEINGVKYKAGITREQREMVDRWIYDYDISTHKPVKGASKFIARAIQRIERSQL